MTGREDNCLRIDRSLAAPRALAFALWTDPALLATWWGPEGMRLATCEIDFRPGGQWRYNMTGRGESHWTSGTYHRIRSDAEITFSYDFDAFDIHSTCTVLFQDAGAETRIRFLQTGFPSEEHRQGHNWGWNSSFRILDDLVRTLPGLGQLAAGLPPACKDGVARDLEAARQRWEQDDAARKAGG